MGYGEPERVATVTNPVESAVLGFFLFAGGLALGWMLREVWHDLESGDMREKLRESPYDLWSSSQVEREFRERQAKREARRQRHIETMQDWRNN